MSELATVEMHRAVWKRLPPQIALGKRSEVGARLSPLDLFLVACWFGLVTGLLELVVLLVRNHFHSKAAMGFLQLNRYYPWMIPTANLMIFGACGAVFGLSIRFWPRIVPYLAISFISFLSLFTLLLGMQRLYTIACASLALGALSWLGPRLASRECAVVRIARASLPALVVFLVVLGVLTHDQLSMADRLALASQTAAKEDAPNVLLVVLDTVRADHLSLYGYDRDTTPNLERLSRRGVRFEHARSSAPWTLPSHATMFTGRWPHQLFTKHQQPLDSTYPTLAEFLRDRGYQTAGFVGNTYFCNAWFGLKRGFTHYEDHFDGNVMVSPVAILRCSTLGRRLLQLAQVGTDIATPRKDAARINRDFLTWLSRREDKQPFFAFLNYIDAHDPYIAPPTFKRHFGIVPRSPADFAALVNWNDRVQKHLLTDREVKLGRDAYDDCIASLDEQLGHLFDTLDARGLMENTLVIVTADHGEHMGEHRLFGHAKSLYRPELDVPLLIIDPRSSTLAGQKVSETVSLRDLSATVIDRVGLGTDHPFPGRTLARHWELSKDRDQSRHDLIFSEVAVGAEVMAPRSPVPALRGRVQSLVVDSNVYMRYGDGSEELFDLESDPTESSNLAGQSRSAPVLKRCRDLLEHVSHDGLDSAGARLTP